MPSERVRRKRQCRPQRAIDHKMHQLMAPIVTGPLKSPASPNHPPATRKHVRRGNCEDDVL